jgi:alpha-tubulin suppressor-like RCC1 family protein
LRTAFNRRVLVAGVIVFAATGCDFFTGPKSAQNVLGPTAVEGGRTFSILATGDSHTCGLTPAGAAFCWGYNSTRSLISLNDVPTGQLGDGSTLDRATPVAVSGGLTFTSITAGAFHTCGLVAGGAAFCWGANRNEVVATATEAMPSGQLGDGTSQHRSSPAAVTGALVFASISAGWFHTCGLTSGGVSYCWGSGGLGVGDTVTRLVPTATTGGLTFQSISAGGTHTCALTAGGAAYCWGANAYGQVGDSTTVGRLTPTLVVGGRTFTRIEAGGNATCGELTNGDVYCWGDNALGSVGDGTNTHRSIPTKVSTTEALGSVVIGSVTASLFAGSSHVCGLTTTGQARCWGNNNAGQLGNNSLVAKSSPVPVPTMLTFQSIAAGGLHTCGITAAGLAYCWGSRFTVGATP